MLGAGLGDGDELGLAVYCGARREHEVLAPVLACHLAQHQGAGDVVPVVLERLLDAFTDGLEAGEVDDHVYVVLVEDALKGLAVENAGLVEAQPVVRRALVGAGDGAHAVERHLARVAQVVDHHHGVPAVQELDAGVAADEAGAAGDQHADVGGLLGERLVSHEEILSRTAALPHSIEPQGANFPAYGSSRVLWRPISAACGTRKPSVRG